MYYNSINYTSIKVENIALGIIKKYFQGLKAEIFCLPENSVPRTLPMTQVTLPCPLRLCRNTFPKVNAKQSLTMCTRPREN